MTDTASPGAVSPEVAEPRIPGLAVALTAIAAWVDAAGFLVASDFFVSFMSGNSTHSVVSLARLDLGGAAIIGAVILLFLAGVVLGELLSLTGAGWRQPLVYLAEAVLLWLVAVALWQDWPVLLALPALALAMGVHNATLHPARGAAVRTYVTGTIVQFGRGLADMARGRGGRAEAAGNGLVWGCFLAGALLGGLAALVLGAAAALALPAAFATGMAALSAYALHSRQRPPV